MASDGKDKVKLLLALGLFVVAGAIFAWYFWPESSGPVNPTPTAGAPGEQPPPPPGGGGSRRVAPPSK